MMFQNYLLTDYIKKNIAFKQQKKELMGRKYAKLDFNRASV